MPKIALSLAGGQSCAVFFLSLNAKQRAPPALDGREASANHARASKTLGIALGLWLLKKIAHGSAGVSARAQRARGERRPRLAGPAEAEMRTASVAQDISA